MPIRVPLAPSSPYAQALQQEEQIQAVNDQAAFEQDFIAKQQREQIAIQRQQEEAAAEAARQQKASLARAKKAGVKINTDANGNEQMVTHEDGQPVYEAGFVGTPSVQGGKASARYRDARGGNYDVPFDAIRSEQDPSGATFYNFDVTGPDGKKQTFRQPEGTTPLFRVDKTTGQRIADYTDPATGSTQTAIVGIDPVAANAAAIQKRRDALQLRQNEISGTAEQLRLEQAAADTKFRPVAERFSAAEKAYEDITKAKTRFEERPDGIHQVTVMPDGQEFSAAINSNDPATVSKAKAWVETAKRTKAEYEAAKAERDPAKAALQTMQEKRDQLALEHLTEKRRAEKEIRLMAEAAKKNYPVYEPEWQKRFQSILEDPRVQDNATIADLEDAGDPLAEDVKRVSRPASATALNAALEAGIVSPDSPLAMYRTTTTQGMMEDAPRAKLVDTVTAGLTAGKPATVADSKAAKELAAKSLGMQPDGVEVSAQKPEGHYELTRNGEMFATLDPRNNRLTLLDTPASLQDKGAEIIANASPDGVPVYMVSSQQPFRPAEVRDLIQEGINAVSTTKSDAEAKSALAAMGLDSAGIRQKVMDGKLSVQDGKLLNDKFNSVQQVNTTAPAVQAEFGKYLAETPIMAEKYRNGSREDKAAVVNQFMDGFAAKASNGVVLDRSALSQRRDELLAATDDRGSVAKGAAYTGGAIKNGIASLAGIGYWMLRAPDRAIRLIGGTDDEGTNLVWNQSRDLVQRLAGENAPWNKDSSPMGGTLGEVQAWADRADSVDSLPDELADKLAEQAFTNYHGFSAESAADVDTTRDTFNIKKNPQLRGMLERYLKTGNSADFNGLFGMLKSNARERETGIALQQYIERPRTATPADAAARAELLGIKLDATKATAVLGIAKQIEEAKDEKQYAALLKQASAVLGLEKPEHAALALSEIARQETTDPDSWTGSFRGASVAGIEEAGTEIVSDVALAALSSTLVGAPEAVALKGAQVAAKQGIRGAFKRFVTHNLDTWGNRSSKFAAIRSAIGRGRAALGRDLTQMGDELQSLGIKKPTFGQPLTTGQKASNLLVGTSKATLAGAPLEAMEEGLTAVLSNDPSAANIGESMLQGALGVGGITPVFAGVQAVRNAFAAKGQMKQWEKVKGDYIAKINEQMGKTPGFKPLTSADFDAWQGLQDNPAHQQATAIMRDAMAEFEAAAAEWVQGAADPATAPKTPRMLAAEARVNAAGKELELSTSSAFMAMDELRAIPEAERPLYTAAAKAAAGVTDFTEAEAKALMQQSGDNAVAFQQAQVLPGDVAGPPAMRTTGAPEVTTAAPGVYRIPAGVKITLPPALMSMLEAKAPATVGLMGGGNVAQTTSQSADQPTKSTKTTKTATNEPNNQTPVQPHQGGGQVMPQPGNVPMVPGQPPTQTPTPPDAAGGVAPPAPAATVTQTALPAKAIEQIARTAVARVTGKSAKLKALIKESKKGNKYPTGGFWMNSDGTIAFHMPTLIRDLTGLGVDNAAIGKRVEYLLDEEIRHAANMEAARRMFEAERNVGRVLRGMSFESWRDAWYGDIWNSHFTDEMRAQVQAAYGDTLPAADWMRAMEGLRMLDQLRATGSITEAVLRALDAVIEALCDFLDLVTAGGKKVIEDEIKAMQEVLAEYGYEAGAVKPDAKKKPAKAKVKQETPSQAIPPATTQATNEEKQTEAQGQRQEVLAPAPETAPDAKPGSPASDGAVDGIENPPMMATSSPEMEEYWPYAISGLRDIQAEGVPDSVKADGGRLQRAIQAGDLATMEEISQKYQRESGRGQGGDGAGPGKVKSPRRGVMRLQSIAEKAAGIQRGISPAVANPTAEAPKAQDSAGNAPPPAADAIDSELGAAFEGLYSAPARITPAQDAEYMAAVESGDVATAQRMVDAALPMLPPMSQNLAEEIDNLVLNSNESGEAVSKWQILQHVIQDSGDKDHWASTYRKELEDLEIKLGVVDGLTKEQVDEIVSTSRKKKYNFKRGDLFYVFRSWDGLGDLNDTGTYDEQGNVIPLSQRFNPESNSILYSAPAATLQQADLPKDHRDAMMKAASAVIDLGLKTPAELARRLDKLAPNGALRKYSRAFWRLMTGFDSTLEESPDWTAIYAGIDVDETPEQPDTQPNDSNSRPNLEPDRQEAGVGDSGGQDGIQPQPGPNGRDGDTMDATGAPSGDSREGGAMPADVPAALGGDTGAAIIREPDAGPTELLPGDFDPRGSRNPDDFGVEVEQRGSNDVAESLGGTNGGAQSLGTGGETRFPELKASAPALTEDQAGDVAFIEARLATKPGVLLTNGTGTGKTFSGLGVVKRMLDAGKKHILIVAPSDKVVNDWIATAKEFFDIQDVGQLESIQDSGTGNRVVVTTYANVGQNAALVSRPWDAVVTDEAHYLSQSKDGNRTNALDSIRALTLHRSGALRYADMALPQDAERLAVIMAMSYRAREQFADEADAIRARLEAKRREYEARHKATAEANRPKVVMLSATPFAYHFSLDYAEGYLFDFPPENTKMVGRYNHPSPRSQFYMENFGYRMRTGKLTAPENATATGILERRFAEKLMREGAMSGRALQVEQDYGRHFVLTESELGTKVDEIVAAIRDNDYLRPLGKYIGLGDYLKRRYLLEALKARESVERIKQHLALGRKVVVFHDYKKGGSSNPLDVDFPEGMTESAYVNGKHINVKLADALEALKRAVPHFDDTARQLNGLLSPLELLAKEFPEMGIFNGDVPAKQRRTVVDAFNKSGSAMNVVLVQRASGKEGISLHDRDGKHQRVFIDLGIPGRPTDAIQSEGRIYRHGVRSNAIVEYLTTGTSFERHTFAQTIAQRASTAENLAMGERARALLQSFATGYMDAETIEPGPQQGTGGKAKDAAVFNSDPFRDAVALYYTNAKKTSRNKSAEGVDYFATPEPLGFKMVEWAGIRPGEKVLEPSAGHGAIARFFPDSTNRHAVEPSNELAGRLALNATDVQIHEETFENYNIGNKFDAIVMNPPFGTAGKTAMDHVIKATKHLRNGGRIVALIPEGSSMEKRFDKWMESDEAQGIYLVAEYGLPPVTFERAGTGVKARVVVLDKTDDPTGIRSRGRRDFAGENVKDFFDAIKESSAPDRATVAKLERPEQTAEIEAAPMTRDTVFPKASVAEPNTFQPADAWHAKKGKPAYVAKISRRLSNDEYAAAKATATKFSGYYSKYDKAGAIPGFQFDTAEDRDAFLSAAMQKRDSASLSSAHAPTMPRDRAEAIVRNLTPKEAAGKLNPKEREAIDEARMSLASAPAMGSNAAMASNTGAAQSNEPSPGGLSEAEWNELSESEQNDILRSEDVARARSLFPFTVPLLPNDKFSHILIETPSKSRQSDSLYVFAKVFLTPQEEARLFPKDEDGFIEIGWEMEEKGYQIDEEADLIYKGYEIRIADHPSTSSARSDPDLDLLVNDGRESRPNWYRNHPDAYKSFEAAVKGLPNALVKELVKYQGLKQQTPTVASEGSVPVGTLAVADQIAPNTKPSATEVNPESSRAAGGTLASAPASQMRSSLEQAAATMRGEGPALAPGLASLFNPRSRRPETGERGLFDRPQSQLADSIAKAYRAVQMGQSTVMVPIRAVFQRLKAANPALTLEDYLAAIQAADERGDVMLESANTTAEQQANAPFVVPSQSGPGVRMAWVDRGGNTGNRPPTTHIMPDGYELTDPGMHTLASAPARVYHGTPHKVNRFRLDKIGSGEGAHAYGWGLYFAQEKAVAEAYRNTLSKPDGSSPALWKAVRDALKQDDYLGYDTASAAMAGIRSTPNWQTAWDMSPETVKAVEAYLGHTGNLYTVELLPDEDEFLEWDKPLSEQSEKVKAAYQKVIDEMPTGFADAPRLSTKEGRVIYQDAAFAAAIQRARKEYQIAKAARDAAYWAFSRQASASPVPVELSRAVTDAENQVQQALRGKLPTSHQEAAEFLAQAGIPGIRYLDGNSRSNGEGTYNYVIFDENLVRILEENGQPIAQDTLASAPSHRTPTQQAIYEIRQQLESADAGRSEYPVPPQRLRKQAKSLLEWGLRNNRTIEPQAFADRATSYDELGGGEEHDVWHDLETGRVLKLTKPKGWGIQQDLTRYLDTIEYSNRVFGDDIAIEAIMPIKGWPHILISQPFYRGEMAPQPDIDGYFADRGAQSTGRQASYLMPDGALVYDAKPRNVLRLTNGEVQPIDVQVALASAPASNKATQAMRDVIEGLPEPHRKVLRDILVNGMSIEDAATTHELSESAVINILRRGEAHVRVMMDAKATKPTVQVEDGVVKAKGGRPDLAMAGNAAFAGIDQRRMTPEEVTHAEMNELAARMFSVAEKDASNLVTRWMDSGGTDFRTTGMAPALDAIVSEAQARNAAQMLLTAAAKLLVTKKAMQGGDTTQLARLIYAYRNTGTEQARALGMRQDPFDTPAERAAMYLQETLLTPPESMRNELRRNPANRERILAAWAKRADQIKAEMLTEGIDLDATFREFAKEQQMAEETIPEPVRPVLARAPKKTRQLVKALLEGLKPSEAIAAAGLTAKAAFAAYKAFRETVNQAGQAAAQSMQDQMLRSAPAADFAANLGLPDLTEAEWLEMVQADKPLRKTPETDKLKQQRERKKAGGELDLRNPKSVRKAQRKFSERKSTAFDKMSEFWRASILSGPQTHVVNIVSGLTYGTYEATFKRLATGAQADIARMFGMKPDAASLADIPAMLAAAFQSVKQAGLDFITEWQSESNVFDSYAMALNDANGQSFKESYGPALAGKLGTIMRGISFRLMGAADAFVKSFFTRIEVVAQARQIARNENLDGEAMRLRIAELTSTTGSEAWERALAQAKRITFQNEEVRGENGAIKLNSPLMAGSRAIDEIDKLALLISRTKKGDFGKVLKGLSHFTFPFVDTPTNIFKAGVTMSPIGGLLAIVDAMRSLHRRKQGNVQEAERIYNAARALDDLANQIVAWGFILGLSELIKPGDDDEELPFMTGSPEYQTTSTGERELMYRAAPPYSIRIGGQWYSYKRLDPFASALSFTIDAIRQFQSGKPIDEVWGRVGLGILTNLKDKTFLQGVSDLVNAATDPERFGTKWATNIAIGFVPNLIRQPIRTGDDVFRENDMPNDMGFWESLGRRVGFGVYPKGWQGGVLPDNPVAFMPAFDIWGREATKNTGTGQPGTDWLLRLFSPVDTRDADNVDPLDRALLRYNMTHDEPFGVAAPSREIQRTLAGKVVKVSLNDAEYTDFVRRAGQAARAMLGDTFNGRDLNEQDIKNIKSVIEKTHDTYRDAAFVSAVQARGGINALADTRK